MFINLFTLWLVSLLMSVANKGIFLQHMSETNIIHSGMKRDYQEVDKTSKLHQLKDAEVEKMLLVRSVILNNLHSHYSLAELARQAGTNECYLKDHFKKVFGVTVYGFTQQAKLEKARELIMEGGQKISAVARSTGYKYTSHFTSSFKKHFGVLPNKVKLLLLLGFQELECITMLFMTT